MTFSIKIIEVQLQSIEAIKMSIYSCNIPKEKSDEITVSESAN
jgi:hypothetical protein